MKSHDYVYIQCLFAQLALGGVVRMNLLPREDGQCLPIPATLNVTLPDPDPSVNATIQLLPTANFTVYQPETPSDLEGLSTDDGIVSPVSHRLKERTIVDSVLGLMRRAGGGGGGGGGRGGGGGGGSTSGGSRGSSSSGSSSSKPATGSSGTSGSSSKPVVAGSGTSGSQGGTFNSKPASPAAPAMGIPVKAPTVVMGYPVYNTTTRPTSNGLRPYYNSLPASRSISSSPVVNRGSPSNFGTYRSTYGSRYYGSYYGYGGYGPSAFGWYPYTYLGIAWWYPSWIYIDDHPSRSTTPVPANATAPQDFSSNVTSSTSIGSQFNDPMSQNISLSQGIVTLDASGTLYGVNEADYNNTNVHWVADHLLDTDILVAFFSASNLKTIPALPGNVSWDSIFYSMRSCGPYPRGVAAILNSPVNLVGLDIVLNHLKSLVLLQPNLPIEWTRPIGFYKALYNYLTLIRPNFLATAQALDTLIVQMAGTSAANDVFSTWAAQRFDNATQLVITNKLPPR